MELNFGIKDWLMIAATLLGPIFAVQAQKYLERVREHYNRKIQVFRVLMSTRAERLSPEHVRSLNMIDLTFNGRRYPFFTSQTKTEKAVISAWKQYHDHLGSTPPQSPADEAVFYAQRDPLFIELLTSMARDMEYPVDVLQLKKGAYSPVAHGRIEDENASIRAATLQVLKGSVPLKFELLAADLDALESHKTVVKKLSVALEGGSLRVKAEREA